MINNSDIRINVNRLYAKESFLELFTVLSPSSERVDFCKGNKPFVSNGITYSPANFEFRKQKAAKSEVPTATLVISNIGRELVREIEKLSGGRGMILRVSQVRPSEQL